MNNQLNQKPLFRIGLLLNKNDGPKTVIISWLINVGFLFYMVFIGWVPGIRAIVANNRSGDMDAAIFGLFYTSGLISMLLCYLSVVPKKRKIMQIFERIDMIENKCKSLFSLYIALTGNSEVLSFCSICNNINRL